MITPFDTTTWPRFALVAALWGLPGAALVAAYSIWVLPTNRVWPGTLAAFLTPFVLMAAYRVWCATHRRR